MAKVKRFMPAAAVLAVVLLACTQAEAGDLDHFEFAAVASPQFKDASFEVTVTAKDQLGAVATGFSGPVDLLARSGPGSTATVLISEVRTDVVDGLELTNVGLSAVDISGWQIVVYDYYTWPAPAGTFVIPAGTLSGQGEVVVVQEGGTAPGTYPDFRTGFSIRWNNNATGNPVAVLLQDAAGNIVDFLCAVDADPTQINAPLAIPGAQWAGPAVPVNAGASATYQRTGAQDANNSGDWTEAAAGLGAVNAGLNVPFVELLAIEPAGPVTFTAGLWTGQVTLLEPAADAYLIAIADGGYYGDSNGFEVQALPPVTVTLPESASEGDGMLADQGQVTIPDSLGSDLTVTLVSDDPSEVTVPAAVVIPAGNTSATFDVTVIDDAQLDGTQVATVTPSAPMYVGLSDTIGVDDNETATLTVTVPAQATEGDGVLVDQGTVGLGGLAGSDVTVMLVSDDPSEATVPAVVVVPSGSSSVTFDVTIVEDTLIDGPQTAQVTATVANWTSGGDSIEILDNESRALTVTLPASATEGDGLLAGAGGVSVPGIAVEDLVIDLASNDTTEVTVPATVTIASGASSTTFDVTVVDDADLDGTQTVQVTASRATFSDGQATMEVYDNDVDHFELSSIGSPQTAGESFAVTITAKDASGLTVPTFQSSVTLSTAGSSGVLAVSPTETGDFTSGVWTGPVTVNGVDTNVVLTAQNSSGFSGSSNVFDVTAGPLDHFEFAAIASPQYKDIPFEVTITAIDSRGFTKNGFSETAELTAWDGAGVDTLIAITEINTASNDSIEFTNVAGVAIDISGWKIVVYDKDSWPSPKMTVLVPGGSVSAAGELFTVVEDGTMPGTYPSFRAGDNINWGSDTSGTPVAVLLLDASDNIVDFACAGLGLPGEISSPMTIPASQWSGGPCPAKSGGGTTYQRQGNNDNNDSSDWIIGSYNVGTLNAGLTVPFAAPILVTPTVTGSFVGGVWTGQITVQEEAVSLFLRATGGGRRGASNTFEVEDLPPLVVTLPESASEGDGVLVGQGSVSTVLAVAGDLAVTLVSGDPSEVTVPPTVVIPAGSTSATFDVTVVDDAVLDGTQVATVAPSAAGYIGLSDTMGVDDNETATLTVTVPAQATEGDGVLVDQGAVSLDGTPADDIVVVVTSSDETEVASPGIVVVPAGQLSAPFDVTVVDDTLIDGPQTATLTAQVTNWVSGDNAIEVLDNEARTLTVSLPAGAIEGNGLLAGAGTVSVPGTLLSDLTVDLVSDDTTELVVPATVVIPEGASEVTFDLTIVDDAELDGTQTVTVTAEAADFAGTSDAMDIYDNDVDHFELATISSPQRAGTPVSVTVMAKDASGETVTTFHSTATLVATGDGGLVPITPTETAAFVNGAWTGQVTFDAVASNVVLSATNSSGFTGVSNAFDVEPGPLRHFQWSPIPSPQFVGVPFEVTITAADANGFTVTDYAFTVELRINPIGVSSITPTTSGNFVEGVWTGQMTVLRPVTGLSLKAEHGGIEGFSNTFDIPAPPVMLTFLPSPGGQITGDTAGMYLQGDVVHLHAEPDPGYEFLTWFVDGIGYGHSPDLELTLNSDKEVEAVFLRQWTLTVNGGSGSGQYDEGATTIVVAQAPSGKQFVRWGGDVMGMSNIYSQLSFITMDRDKEITAIFATPGDPIVVTAGTDEPLVYQNTEVVTADRHHAVLELSIAGDTNGNAGYEVDVSQVGGPGDVVIVPTGDPLVWHLFGSRSNEGSAGDVQLAVTVVGDTAGTGSTSASLTVRILGDVDGNGAVEPGDLMPLTLMLNGILPPGYSEKILDIDGNGAVEPGDVSVLTSLMNGQVIP